MSKTVLRDLESYEVMDSLSMEAIFGGKSKSSSKSKKTTTGAVEGAVTGGPVFSDESGAETEEFSLILLGQWNTFGVQA